MKPLKCSIRPTRNKISYPLKRSLKLYYLRTRNASRLCRTGLRVNTFFCVTLLSCAGNLPKVPCLGSSNVSPAIPSLIRATDGRGRSSPEIAFGLAVALYSYVVYLLVVTAGHESRGRKMKLTYGYPTANNICSQQSMYLDLYALQEKVIILYPVVRTSGSIGRGAVYV